jgi:hypothetical protein
MSVSVKEKSDMNNLLHPSNTSVVMDSSRLPFTTPMIQSVQDTPRQDCDVLGPEYISDDARCEEDNWTVAIDDFDEWLECSSTSSKTSFAPFLYKTVNV